MEVRCVNCDHCLLYPSGGLVCDKGMKTSWEPSDCPKFKVGRFKIYRWAKVEKPKKRGVKK